MKRSGPPQRRTPLQRSTGLQGAVNGNGGRTRSPLRRQSTAKARAQAERRALIARMIEAENAHPANRYRQITALSCRICPLVRERLPQVPAPACQGEASGLHERRKRSSMGSLTNPENLVPACNVGNEWVENYPELAHRLGLVVRPGDEEWEALGANRREESTDA